MTASLFLLGLCWLLPLSLVGWSYYRYYTRQHASASSYRVITETVEVDLHSGSWMVVTSLDDEVAMPLPARSTYQTTISKAQAVVRLHTPTGAVTHRRCDTFLN